MIKAGIIGGSGYTGQELYRLLSGHPQVSIELLTSRTYAGKSFESVYGSLMGAGSIQFSDISITEAAETCDVLFLALPHGLASHQVTGKLLEQCVVIDLGADYRLSSQDMYEQWYKCEHGSPDLLEQSVYGLCELFRNEVRESRLVANPGCYTTCSILTTAPLLKEGLVDPDSLIIDAKSGVSGAGRAAKTANLMTECSESIKAYGVASHRHTPEIEEQLSRIAGSSIVLSFTPHLVPMNRGILVTAYASLKPGVSVGDVAEAYEKAYGTEHFVRVLPNGTFPETRWVKGSNFCDIGYTIDHRTGRIIMGGAIDNLVKGASGQAIQNMNIVFGFDEKEGIDQLPLFP